MTLATFQIVLCCGLEETEMSNKELNLSLDIASMANYHAEHIKDREQKDERMD